mgnify:FL=1
MEDYFANDNSLFGANQNTGELSELKNSTLNRETLDSARFFNNKKILITGGTGTIGRALVKELLLNHNPAVIRIFDLDETRHFEFEHELTFLNPLFAKKTRFLLGDVKDSHRVDLAMQDIDIVFHLAALKHVKGCEYNPFEAVKTNIIGTQNIIDAAIKHNIQKLIYTSSDKAVYPYNTMGATKLVAERLVTSANYYRGSRRTIFSSVRFGNVMGSRGSVIPLFKNQIKNGGPVTITHPDMKRFTMSCKDAVNLIIKCAQTSQGGEVFILKMPVIKILDLAELLITELAPRYGRNSNSIRVDNIGLKEGETMDEELITDNEAARALEIEDMFIVPPFAFDFNISLNYPDAKQILNRTYNSKQIQHISKDELKNLLMHTGVLE